LSTGSEVYYDIGFTDLMKETLTTLVYALVTGETCLAGTQVSVYITRFQTQTIILVIIIH